MGSVWKKWIATNGGMRVIVALLYLFTAFGVPLSHTCQLVDEDIHHCHSEYSSRLLYSDSYVKVRSVITFNQNGFTKTAESHVLSCPVCLHSLTSKAFKFCSNTSLYSTQTVISTQILLQLSFIKQIEWFCSAPLSKKML